MANCGPLIQDATKYTSFRDQITILLGGVFVLIIPVSPGTAWFLTTEERAVAEQRVAQEHAVSRVSAGCHYYTGLTLNAVAIQSAQHTKFQWDQATATLKDVKFWLVSL